MTVESVDLGYFTGSMTYAPSWGAPVSISIGTGPDPVYGIAWLWESIKGWDSPDVAGQVLQRGADHGGWPAGQWYAPRALTLQLRASAPNQTARDIARTLLQQIIPPGDLALLQYNEIIPKQAYVRRAGKVTETYDNLAEVDFACVLIAPDPRKYSTQVTTWGTASLLPQNFVTVGSKAGSTYTTLPMTLAAQPAAGMTGAINAGNFETRPVAFIYGPVNQPFLTLVNTGQIVSWSNLNIASGSMLMVDFDSHMAFLNPNQILVPGGPPAGISLPTYANISGYIPADILSSWFVIQPGFNSIQLGSGSSSSSPSGQLVVTHRNAYM
jgi:hypothetical protein